MAKEKETRVVQEILNDKTDSVAFKQNAKGHWTAEVKVYGNASKDLPALMNTLFAATEAAKKRLAQLNEVEGHA